MDGGASWWSGLAIFPLPRVVLLPGEQLPLHVFEPRYRALVAWCRAEGAPFGVATLRGGVDARGRAAIHPEIGVGRITRFRAHPDGRSDLVVSHEVTVTALKEVETAEPFRRVRVAPLAPPPLPSAAELGSLRLLALQVATRVGPALDTSAWTSLSPEAWLHAVARSFLTDAEARRAYLAAATGTERVALVRSVLAGLVEHVVPAVED